MNVMAVFAHPDDETICAGTLAGMAAAGHKVQLVCATRGEQGEIVDPGIDARRYPKGPALGELREAELSASCRALGIRQPLFLDFEDSGFPILVGVARPSALCNQDVGVVETKLLALMQDHRPEVMITFDPHGFYDHVDHVIIHQVASRAFWAAGGTSEMPPTRLYFPVRTVEQVREAKRRRPGTATSTLIPEVFGVSEASVAVTCDVSAFARHKVAAMKAHASQFGAAAQVEDLLARQSGVLECERFVIGGLRPAGSSEPLGGGGWL